MSIEISKERWDALLLEIRQLTVLVAKRAVEDTFNQIFNNAQATEYLKISKVHLHRLRGKENHIRPAWKGGEIPEV